MSIWQFASVWRGIWVGIWGPTRVIVHVFEEMRGLWWVASGHMAFDSRWTSTYTVGSRAPLDVTALKVFTTKGPVPSASGWFVGRSDDSWPSRMSVNACTLDGC